MPDFFAAVRTRNETLFFFGLICFLLAALFLALTWISSTRINNVSSWYKPFKFALSIGVYAWTMAWYCYYLPSFNTSLFNWVTIALLGFEIIYIAIQAARGELSHFNLSTPFYHVLYMSMALAATIVTLYTAYIGFLFLKSDFVELPNWYVWAIRSGILIFVVFSFEGFLMGARLSHTIGGPDGGEGIRMLNWSTKWGDPRIAHFIGMHALQVVPFLSFYVLKNTKLTILISCLYGMLALFTLIQALQGKPFLSAKNPHKNETFRK